MPTITSLTREEMDRVLQDHFEREADGDVEGTLTTFTGPAPPASGTGTCSPTSKASEPTSSTASTVTTSSSTTGSGRHAWWASSWASPVMAA